MKVIKTISLSLLVCSSLSFGWEVNTHRAIDRCAIVEDAVCGRGEVAKNLHWFAENNIPKEKGKFESYVNEKLENYTLIKKDKDGNQVKGDDATYFSYVMFGEPYAISTWHQTFSNNYDYIDLIEAGTILEDALYPGENINVTSAPNSCFDLVNQDSDSANGRFNFHFYDPQDNGNGLSVVPKFPNENAINWAKDGATSDKTNDYTYDKAKEYFKKGFTEKKYENRKKYRAKMFVSLGYLLHLLNDMNVPAHTRDDSHPCGDPLEVWMRGGKYGKNNGGFKIYSSILDNPTESIINKVKIVQPLKYSSFRVFYEKQAEFTGTNFYSEDSISVNGGTFGGYSDYHPKKSEVNVYTGKSKGFITSNNTELGTTNKLAMMQKSKIPFKDYWYAMEIDGDKSALLDNGINLIPRAIANAEGFVNYFFRGRLQATLKDGNLTIKNVSVPNLVASEDIVKFNDSTYKVYYETDNNETYLLQDCTATNALSVDDSFECDISQKLEERKNEIGKAQKLTVIYYGTIGNEKGVSVSIAKKLTDADILFSFDKSGSMGSSIENAKNSAKDILDSVVGVDNNSTFIEVEAFSYGAGVVLAYENNVTKAKDAINTIYSGGMTALYDAIKLAGNNAVAHKTLSGISKSIVILYTDGRENSSSASRQQAIDAISNAKASSIDEVFLIFVGNDSYGKAKLKSIADEAGRKFMSVSNASGLKDAIEKILKGQ
ncbi:MAG: VWA domain-containing protein [Epsilonproteobacteria bacterium]|nr:VWA domain-containing protein [Campylobacterota bacterium]